MAMRKGFCAAFFVLLTITNVSAMESSDAKQKKIYRIYFAGELYDFNQVYGNKLLADDIEKLSDGKYKCVLPQDLELPVFDGPVHIRNTDIKAVVEADVALFNFNGSALSQGTTVEFMLAKMLDIPSVLSRTDSRPKNWSVMISGFPRCVEIIRRALKFYCKNSFDREKLREMVAQDTLKALDEALAQKPKLRSYDKIAAAYSFVVDMCDGDDSDLAKLLPEDYLQVLVKEKIEKGVYGKTEERD